jgi:putative flavoprotein involved in K+ transport
LTTTKQQAWKQKMLKSSLFPISLSMLLPLFMVCLSAAFVKVTPGRAHREFDTTKMDPSKTAFTTTTRIVATNNGDDNNDNDDDDFSHSSRLATATTIAEEWIRDFSRALSERRIDDVVNLFVDDPEGEEYVGPLPEGAKTTQKQFPPFWRDMVAYTWNIVTLEGKESIRDMLEETGSDSGNASTTTTWKLATPRPSGRDSFPPPLKITVVDSNANNNDDDDDDDDNSSICEFWCDITTAEGTGYGHVRLDAKTKRATTVLTTLLELHDQPFRTDHKRSRGSVPGPVLGRQYFHEQQQRDDKDGEEYHVAIVGAGQAGLSLAARLEAMEIPYILFEAGPSPGSSWRHARYPSLHLHDPVWYQHLPYMEFPKTWPIFTPKDKLADWMDSYATLLNLNLRTNTKVTKATEEYHGKSSDNNDKTWRIETISTSNNNNNNEDDGQNNRQRSSTIRARHIVFATGNSSRPKIPNFPGASSVFNGIQLHTSRYTGGRPFAGKKVVVIGSNNSGFDICQDLWEQGAGSVTMIQRTGSMIVSSKSVLEQGLFLYTEDPQYHHEDADLLLTTTPYRILAEGGGWKSVTNKMKEIDRDLIARVEASGYKFDYGYDGTGLFAKSATEGGGFYIDVGCAELLARKDVGVKYANVERLELDAVVVFNKDSCREERLPADVVVYATGFDMMESYVEQICGRDIFDKVGKVSEKKRFTCFTCKKIDHDVVFAWPRSRLSVISPSFAVFTCFRIPNHSNNTKTWGLGLDYKPDKDPGPWTGELRNMWKPTNVDGLWFHGGNLAQCRHYSKFLALQLAARYGNKFGGDVDSEENKVDQTKQSSSVLVGEPRVYGIPPPAFVTKASKEARPASVASSI